MSQTLQTLRALVVVALVASGCGRAKPAPAPGTATPVYNQQTGRLEALLSDRDGDGTIDTRAQMDGTRLVRIEIDRNGDGSPDRVEEYAAAARPGGTPEITEAEETQRPGGPVTRRELYAAGTLVRVEEDTDSDGRFDKWEQYANGRVSVLELDLSGAGRATRRLVYASTGGLDRIEVDPDGDGVFTALSSPTEPEGAARP